MNPALLAALLAALATKEKEKEPVSPAQESEEDGGL